MAPRMLSPAVCAPADGATHRDRTPVTATAKAAARLGVRGDTGPGLGFDKFVLLAMR
jgi:hypothetical protein